MTPQFVTGNLTTPTLITSWPAVGLLSAPTLSPSLTTGQVNGNAGYEITGSSQVNGTIQQKINDAQNKSNQISTILSGGALPVQVIVGQPITTPATLGKHFEVISAIALLLAILAVSITIVIRYKKLFLIAPIILTTLAELFIIGSIMGLAATIDLSAVAGMIAVIGTGVDAQIIITDEVLAGHKDTTMKTRMSSAFYLVMRNALLLSLAMLPLFFSALTTEIWFAGATIIGALLGAVITRPAYGAIVSKHYASRVENVVKHCPICNKSSADVRFYGEFCEKCASDKLKERLPTEVEVERCRVCGKIRTKEGARTEDKSSLLSVIQQRFIKFKVYLISFGDGKALIDVVDQRNDQPLATEKEVAIKYRKMTCESCYKRIGGYYEATIQLRGDDERIERFMERLTRYFENRESS